MHQQILVHIHDCHGDLYIIRHNLWLQAAVIHGKTFGHTWRADHHGFPKPLDILYQFETHMVLAAILECSRPLSVGTVIVSGSLKCTFATNSAFSFVSCSMS